MKRDLKIVIVLGLIVLSAVSIKANVLGIRFHTGSSTTPISKEERSVFWYLFKANAIFFVFNILVSIVYIRWAAKQKITSEILLYQVRGKFTKYNLLLWIERIEGVIGKDLSKLKNKVGRLHKNARRSRLPVAVYRKKITKLIFKCAFGPNKKHTAFKRMHKNTKLLLISYLLQMVGSTVLIFKYLYQDGADVGLAIGLSIVSSLCLGIVFWLIIFSLLLLSFSIYTDILVEERGHAGYLHVSLAQLSMFGWNFKAIPQRALMKLTDIEIENGKSKIVFTNFRGGGSGGNW